MAEAGTGGQKSEEQDKETKHFTITLPSPDGTSKVVALLEQDEDTAQPPRLIEVTKHPLENITSTTSATHEDRETHIILSQGSGHQKASDFFSSVVSPILSALYGPEALQTFRTHVTESPTSILELVDQVLFPEANGSSRKPLRIILASGDGGVVDLVNGLLKEKASKGYIAPQVVLLPLGTANALYHSINAGTGTKNTWGLNALSSTVSKPLPVFTAAFSPGARLLIDEARAEEELARDNKGNGILHGAVVCSWGMHASLVADSDTAEYRKFGIDRFKMAAKEALYPSDGSAPHPYKARVSVLKGDDWTALKEQEHMYVLATLVSNLESPFCISPASKPLDNSLHLVHFGPTSGDEAMRIMGLAYQGGKHVDDPAVRYEAIDGLKIEFQGDEDGRWRRVCVDGKIVRVEGNGWVEVRKEERRVLDVVVA
ncbi:ATP-NAD kinase-like domain-containing protein [Pyrenochaeta sp. MPI-SDFR-AT-0127]|nr:ATP-NAD kinase-like domain-containing protein [Pyrenochaeta sp. MPI-SDFR-AT-0127]